MARGSGSSEEASSNKPLQQTARASAALRAAPTRPQLKGVVFDERGTSSARRPGRDAGARRHGRRRARCAQPHRRPWRRRERDVLGLTSGLARKGRAGQRDRWVWQCPRPTRMEAPPPVTSPLRRLSCGFGLTKLFRGRLLLLPEVRHSVLGLSPLSSQRLALVIDWGRPVREALWALLVAG